jgi:hypothetical protein
MHSSFSSAGQFVHCPQPEICPAGQAVHSSALPSSKISKYVPRGQVTHLVLSSFGAVPPGHHSQDLAPWPAAICPAKHAVHSIALVWAACEPGWQLVHARFSCSGDAFGAGSATNFPKSQSKHSVQPGCAEYVPASQFMHSLAPASETYVPRGHSWQPVFNCGGVGSAANVPASQTSQSVSPSSFEYRPTPQFVHPLAPSSAAYVPTGHITQAAIPGTSANVPGSHSPHSVELTASEYCPASQSAHGGIPSPPDVPGGHAQPSRASSSATPASALVESNAALTPASHVSTVGRAIV